MRLFNNMTIKRKLVVIITSISIISLLFGFGYIFIDDISSFKRDLVNSSVTNAKLIGEYSVVPLIFDDKTQAAKNLAILKKIQTIEEAYIYKDGKEFVSYHRDNGNQSFEHIEFAHEKISFSNQLLHVYQPIIYQNEECGVVYLIVSTSFIKTLANKNLIMMLVLIVVLLIVSLLLANTLQQFITNPILKLIYTMDSISQKADYSVRIERQSDDEIGKLYNEFNRMLEQISIREQERDQASMELRKLQHYLSNIIDSMPSVLVGIDKQGKITQWNLKAKEVTGVDAENAQGKLLNEVFPRLSREMKNITEAIKTKQTRQDPKIPYTLNNETRYDDITIYPLITNGIEGAVIRLDDVTDKVRLEEMMIQSGKMLSVGGLAAGMAHEINNPLAGMIQNASVVLNRLTQNIEANDLVAAELNTSMDVIRSFMEKRKIIKMLELIRESGDRASQIVQNMLSFARKSDSRFLKNNIDQLMDKTLDLAQNDYDLKKKYDFRQIEIIKEYQKNLPAIPCEASKLQQVFLNILKNGTEAMANNRQNNKISQFIIRLYKDKQTINIEIEDNGPGMEESVKKRIFEPFYTTKGVGEGTGLGLSVSYFIIAENHHGTMEVESIVGHGTKFIIKLPLD